jgi:hypothetical protein
MDNDYDKSKNTDSLIKLPDGRILNANLEDIVPDDNKKDEEKKEDFTG